MDLRCFLKMWPHHSSRRSCEDGVPRVGVPTFTNIYVVRRMGARGGSPYFEMVEAEVFTPVRSTCAVVGTFSIVRSINRSTTAFRSLLLLW
jgi:hypothetical protein